MIELKGAPVSNKIINELKVKLTYLSELNIIPKLAIIRIGNEKDDISYEKSIINKFNNNGVATEVNILPVDISDEDLKILLVKLNEDENIHGVIIFNSISKHINKNIINKTLNIKKDVDCMTYNNTGKLFIDTDGFKPCTPDAVIELLDYYNINLSGKKVTVIGRSLTVGKPLSIMLLNKDATVTMCHSKTNNLIEECKRADIIISCTGKANLITDKYVNKEQIIIDIGLNYHNGKLCGDVDYDSVKNKVKMITPSIGGVGIITTTILLKNTINSAYFSINK